MKYIDFGLSGMMVSEIGLGCMYMKDMPSKDAAEVLQTAYDNGINFFDHADIYGDGECEKLFGEALRQTGIDREDIFIETKCGIDQHIYDFSKEHILEAVDGSLKRLGVDYVDVLLLHRPDALMEPEEIAEAFDMLHNRGKVRQFGVSNHHPMQMELLNRYVNQRLIANQLRFSPVHTGVVDCGILVNTTDDGAIHRDGMILDYCRINDITVQAWSPYQYGENDGVYLGSPEFEELNNAINKVGETHGMSPEATVASWILRHPARMQVLTGSMNPDRIKEICSASGNEITRREWYNIYEAAGNKIP